MRVDELESLRGRSSVHVFLVLKAARAVQAYAEKSVSRLELCGQPLCRARSPAAQRAEIRQAIEDYQQGWMGAINLDVTFFLS